MSDALTPKQSRFVQEYLVDLNGKQAAIRSGYSSNGASVTGSRLLADPKIRKAVEKAQRDRSEATRIDADFVLRKSKELLDRCMADIRPALDRKGKQITDEDGNPLFKFDSAGAAKALRLLGDHVNVAAFDKSIDLRVTGELSLIDRLNAGRRQVKRPTIDADYTEVEEAVALPATKGD